MGTDTGSFELEDNVVVEYEVEWSPYVPAVIHLAPEDCSPAEGGVEGISWELVIKSDGLIDHMIMLGDLAANYTDRAIGKAAIEHWERKQTHLTSQMIVSRQSLTMMDIMRGKYNGSANSK